MCARVSVCVCMCVREESCLGEQIFCQDLLPVPS